MSDEYTVGCCRYCGQTANVYGCSTQDEADERAARRCTCPDGRQYREERAAAEKRDLVLAKAAENIDLLLGGAATGYGLEPVDGRVAELARTLCALVYDGALLSAAIRDSEGAKITVKFNTRDALQLNRGESSSYTLEA